MIRRRAVVIIRAVVVVGNYVLAQALSTTRHLGSEPVVR
jgi:hypothetical protein